jgi:hypothetical protein
MRIQTVLLVASLSVLAGPAQAEPLQQKIQRGVFQVRQAALLGKVSASPLVSNQLKGTVKATRGSLSDLRKKADRVVMSSDDGASTASYYSGKTLVGTAVLSKILDQTTLTVTSYFPAHSSQISSEVFTTGRGALKLLASELSLGITGKKSWQLVRQQIAGELVNGTSTAGARQTVVSDIGRSEKTIVNFNVEQWLTRGLGAPKNSALPDAPARWRGKAVVGSFELRTTRYVLDASGRRVPNPDPEAEGRPMRETLGSVNIDYHVDPSGAQVFHAQAQ